MNNFTFKKIMFLLDRIEHELNVIAKEVGRPTFDEYFSKEKAA